MNNRNLAVAAVTAVIVTTALVGTTLPDIVADRINNAVEQRDRAAPSRAAPPRPCPPTHPSTTSPVPRATAGPATA
ncbi:hypothetical protein [Nesterenkonia pannonica]|uniref:hypothetical protein n=1 Tax=Nesterenkonia pannonica TaxID=1548602 RepID=UPI002164E51E|nr:hypothetical protein [Nesterenkonia pannonica]